MKSSKVLEMIRQNRIEDLTKELQDEIFTESLKTKPNAKKRYAAMKRYLKTISESRPILTKPCEVEFESEKYNSFTNMYSLVLTKESCGELEMCSEPDRYPDVTRLINFGNDVGRIDLNKVLAEAKSKGYKYTKTGIQSNDFLMHYKGAYFRMALVDLTYGLLDKGEEIDVYFSEKLRPITIRNELGVGIILPIRWDGADGSGMEDVVVVEA